MFVYRVSVRLFAVFALLAPLLAVDARAQDEPASLPDLSAFDFLTGHADLFSGFDASGRSWSAYSTAVLSPLGPLHQDGLRLRLTGSYSAWSYDTKSVYCSMSSQQRKRETGSNFDELCNDIADRALTAQEQAAINKSIKPYGLHTDGEQIYLSRAHEARRYDVAVMPGLQTSWRAAIVKAYIGPAVESRSILPADPRKAISGMSWGAKGAVEGWMRLGEAFWISGDGGYFSGTETYSGLLRLGYEPLDWLTVGPELAVFGDAEDDSTRAGGFLRLTIGKVETTLSGGVSAEYDGTMAAYGAAGVYTKF